MASFESVCKTWPISWPITASTSLSSIIFIKPPQTRTLPSPQANAFTSITLYPLKFRSRPSTLISFVRFAKRCPIAVSGPAISLCVSIHWIYSRAMAATSSSDKVTAFAASDAAFTNFLVLMDLPPILNWAETFRLTPATKTIDNKIVLTFISFVIVLNNSLPD